MTKYIKKNMLIMKVQFLKSQQRKLHDKEPNTYKFTTKKYDM